METADIFRITRLRIDEDGRGVRSVIFLCGCPLSCVWCCNPEICNHDKFKSLTTDELYKYVAKDAVYFRGSGGGVTFSGGEPLLYSEYIRDFADKYCRDFSVDIETSLYADTKDIERLIPVIDEWLIDFKVFDEKKHLEYTGVSNSIIKRNLEFLSENISPSKICITYPVIPDYNTSDDNLTKMTDFLHSLGITRLELHPYRKFQEDKHRSLGLVPTVIEKLSMEKYESVRHKLEDKGFEIPEFIPCREKDKCIYLKKIRKNLVCEHNIPVEIMDCDFEDRCIGTCPRCEYELDSIYRYLRSETNGI